MGRTGSGKSSLFQALFRTTEIVSSIKRGGRENKGEERGDQRSDQDNVSMISIDGVNIQKLSLRNLRKHVSIIPQQPFLFR